MKIIIKNNMFGDGDRKLKCHGFGSPTKAKHRLHKGSSHNEQKEKSLHVALLSVTRQPYPILYGAGRRLTALRPTLSGSLLLSSLKRA